MENYNGRSEREISVADWIFTLIISSIPFLGIISLLMWAFSRSTPICKANWAKAWLFLQVIGYVLAILMWGSLISIFQMGLFD
jgi:hypothetical protein